MVSEPTAAILAYDARPEAELKDKIIVVADLGGTRSDVAVIASRGGIYSVLSTKHDYETAGAQLDQVLIDHFSKEFMKKHKTDPRQNPRSLAKLKLEAEATKKALSLGGNAALSVESLADGVDFASTINRTRYELLAGKVFNSFVNLIKETIQSADLDILDVDEVCSLSLFPGHFCSVLRCPAGNSFRRHITHPTYLILSPISLPTRNPHPLTFNSPHRRRPSFPICPRGCHPSVPYFGIRPRRHRTVDSPCGNRHSAPRQRHWHHDRQRRHQARRLHSTRDQKYCRPVPESHCDERAKGRR